MIRDKRELAASILANKEARILCGLLLEETGVMRSTMREDDRLTAYAEGQRSAGLILYSLLWGLKDTAPIECMREYGEWLDITSNGGQE